MTRSTRDGWCPEVGDLVYETMWAPGYPGLTLEERIATGETYGPPRRLMRVHGVTPDWSRPGVTRWHLRPPDARLGSNAYDPNCSLVESDWAVLEDAATEAAQPALW